MFRPRDVKELVVDYLEECLARGLREVRFIHGKGIGVQRTIVQEILGQLVVVDLVILPTVYTFSYEGVAPCGQQLDESWMFMNSTGIFGSVEVGVRCGSCPQ